jgi:hypothetical protein
MLAAKLTAMRWLRPAAAGFDETGLPIDYEKQCPEGGMREQDG